MREHKIHHSSGDEKAVAFMLFMLLHDIQDIMLNGKAHKT